MSAYNFVNISPIDFELLSRDLLQAEEGLFLESFKTGKDFGIDFRYARGAQYVVVQCKHYVGSGISALLTSLKKEVSKVAKLSPSRYILFTSVGLSPANKKSIKNIFGSCLVLGDIFGADDLNNLLERHAEVENRHYKLWLTSRAVLDRVIHNGSVVQSEFDVRRILKDARRYVLTAFYTDALAVIKNNSFVVISGVPGVGKSSLARILIFTYLEMGYELISITANFRSARDRFQNGKKQIFYFDDFLGATFLGDSALQISRNEDQEMLDFIDLVKESAVSKMVLTTRNHFLNQIIAASERVKNSGILDSRYVLEMSAHTEGQRAQILYNHIYFSDLPYEYREILLADRFYMEIINHKNFNPRLVEWLSSFYRVKCVQPTDYKVFVRTLLEKPFEIWRHAYENQISDAGRSVLLALYSVGGKSSLEFLEAAFVALHAFRAKSYGFKTDPSDWRRATHEVTGSFIFSKRHVEFINPSVKDLVDSLLCDDTLNALNIISASITFSQIRAVWDFAKSANGEAVYMAILKNPSVIGYAVGRYLIFADFYGKDELFRLPSESIESRIITLIEISNDLDSVQLSNDLSLAIKNFIYSEKYGTTSVADGLALIKFLDETKLIFDIPKSCLRTKIFEIVVSSAADGCSSRDAQIMFQLAAKENKTKKLKGLLFLVAGGYRINFFSKELLACKCSADFEVLQNLIELMAEVSGYDFRGAVATVIADNEEFDANENSYETRRYEEWRELAFEAKNNSHPYDDIFDSLRKN